MLFLEVLWLVFSQFNLIINYAKTKAKISKKANKNFNYSKKTRSLKNKSRKNDNLKIIINKQKKKKKLKIFNLKKNLFEFVIY